VTGADGEGGGGTLGLAGDGAGRISAGGAIAVLLAALSVALGGFLALLVRRRARGGSALALATAGGPLPVLVPRAIAREVLFDPAELDVDQPSSWLSTSPPPATTQPAPSSPGVAATPGIVDTSVQPKPRRATKKTTTSRPAGGTKETPPKRRPRRVPPPQG
jgi:hypothetical protein